MLTKVFATFWVFCVEAVVGLVVVVVVEFEKLVFCYYLELIIVSQSIFIN